jgi:hypothetical protein
VKKDFYIFFSIILLATIPILSVFAAQVTQLNSNNESNCHDFTKNLRFTVKDKKNLNENSEISALQLIMKKEGFLIRQAQLGFFGLDTFLAVVGFQEKYKEDILTPAGLLKGNGYVGPLTRNKLNSLYGCQNKLSMEPEAGRIILKIKGILLDKNGISITFCNLSSQDITTFPIRVRLNGIIREFDVLSALQKNTCYPAHWSYETWGLAYDQDTIYTVVVLIDPFGYYKKGAILYPDLETISIPALQGMSLSVKSLLFKSNNSIQATFCNMGTEDVSNFPVRAVLNDIEKDFNITGALKSGKCNSSKWNFDSWGIKYSAGTLYKAVFIIDKNLNDSDNKNLNEFSNAAAITGIL